jgi:hypothetical protein
LFPSPGWKEQETVDYVVSRVLSSSVTSRKVHTMRRKYNDIPQELLYKKSGGITRVVFKLATQNITSAITSIQNFHKSNKEFMDDNQVDQAKNYLMSLQAAADKFPYQVLSMYRNVIDVKLIWDIKTLPVTCQLVISKYL